MTRLSDKHKRRLFVICTFIVSAVLFYGMEMGRGVGVNADETSNYYAGEELFDGNFFMKGWHFSTGLFLLPTYEITILTKILGYHDGVIYLISAVNYTLLVTLSLYAVYKAGEWYKINKKIIYVVFAALVMYIPRAPMIYNCATHVFCIAVSIAVLYLFYYLRNVKMKLWIRGLVIVLLVIVMGYLSVTNTMFMYSALFPLILTGVCIAVQERDIKTGLPYIVPGILSVISQVIWKNIFLAARDGIRLGSSPTTFVSKNHMWESFCESMYDTLQLFGMDIWNKEVFSTDTLKAVLGLAVLLKLMLELVRFFKNKKGKYAIFIYMFLMLAFVNFCAYMFSTMALANRSTHLIYSILFGVATAGTIAWIMNIHHKVSAERWIPYMAAAAALFCLMLPDISFRQPESYMDKVAEYLNDHGYTNGYGGFWCASTIMYYAGGYGNEAMEIIPVAKDTTDRLQICKWMKKDDHIEHQANFLVFNRSDRDQFSITEDAIINTFGRWSKKLEFNGGIMLYLWNERISTNGLWGSGSYNGQMSLSDSGMRQDDGSIVIRSSDIMFGPYVHLEKGDYNLIVEAEGVTDQKIKIMADSGQKEIITFLMTNGKSFYTFHLKEDMQAIEFLVDGTDASDENPLMVKNIYLAASDMYNVLSVMDVTDMAMIADNGDVSIEGGQTLQGLDMNLQKGTYEIVLETEMVSEDAVLTVTADHGASVLNTFELTGRDDIFYLDLKEPAENVAFLMKGSKEGKSIVKSISLQKIYSLQLAGKLTVKDHALVSTFSDLEAGTYRMVTKSKKTFKDVKKTVIDRNGNVLASELLQKGEQSMLFTLTDDNSIQAVFAGNISGSDLTEVTIEKIYFTEYLDQIQLSEDPMRQEDGSVLISGGNMIFGPYINVKEGRHCLKADILEAPEEAEVVIRKGNEDMAVYRLDAGENIFDLYMENGKVNGKKSEDIGPVEFMIKNDSDVPVHISSLSFE